MESNDVLSNWSQAEKYYLLEALKENGSLEVLRLCAMLSSKTREEIEQALEAYKERALKPETLKSSKRKMKEKNFYVPLSSWGKLICERCDFSRLSTEIATSLRLLADYEDRPPASCTEKIDFNKVYKCIADAIESKCLRENTYVMTALDMCILETALSSKTFFKTASYRQVLKSIITIPKKLTTFPSKHEKDEVTYLRQLADQIAYNPLHIPEHFLKYEII